MRSDKTIIIMNYDYEENRGNRRRPTYVELCMQSTFYSCWSMYFKSPSHQPDILSYYAGYVFK